MFFIYLAERILQWGCLGFIIEVFFTGIHSVFVKKSLLAESRTYLWMILVYGTGGLFLEILCIALGWNPLLKSMVSMVAIFGVEFMWGWLFEFMLGVCPWKYLGVDGRNHPLSVLGYIRLDYAPYWYMLVIIFNTLYPIYGRCDFPIGCS